MAEGVQEVEDLDQDSNAFETKIQGPLVSLKLPMDELIMEYAQAELPFRIKTQNLARTQAAYRRIAGDHHCGWRALVFSYFESLLRVGNSSIIRREKTRLENFQDTMRAVGIDYEILEDWLEYTWSLFADIETSIERHDRSENVILEAMNDRFRSYGIIYHFKMMTSSLIQINADSYQGFLGMTVQEYRERKIESVEEEIDEIGLRAFSSGIIQPSGFGVEVSYLDQSGGDEVTKHEIVPAAHDMPTIRLLYRPGHYDIIYGHEATVMISRGISKPDDVYNPDLPQFDTAYLHLNPNSGRVPNDDGLDGSNTWDSGRSQ